MITPTEERSLIDDLLAEQQKLTAVQRFARKHVAGALPAQSRYYRDLIPLQKPAAGEQYAFAVDLDACTGCKACVSACHSLNGLDEDEIWRSVGLLHGGSVEEPYQQTVTTACHHCEDPACLNGCPVKAYEKDSDTGIVRHLDDQCIGCQYCILKCPYDVPKYSAKRGIVRKCDMCHSRLAANEAPACAQACPTSAISIRVVSRVEVRANTRPGTKMLPGAFDSSYTSPTTHYTSRRPSPAPSHGADAGHLRLEHAHWPLLLMLLLTQLSVGLFTVLAMGGGSSPGSSRILSLGGFLALQAGLAVSVLHLGRPLGAWRAFLGVRTSWMSREILAFSLFAACAGATLLAVWWSWIMETVPQLGRIAPSLQLQPAASLLAWMTLLLGLAGIYCSAMIYIDTRRVLWRSGMTHWRFFGTALVLGLSAAACLLSWQQVSYPTASGTMIQTCILLALAFRAALFGFEAIRFSQARRSKDTLDHRSTRVVSERLPHLAISYALLCAGAVGCALLAMPFTGLAVAILSTLGFVFTFCAQLIERYTFFVAVVALRMPGGVAA